MLGSNLQYALREVSGYARTSWAREQLQSNMITAWNLPIETLLQNFQITCIILYDTNFF